MLRILLFTSIIFSYNSFSKPIKGYANLHVYMFGNLGFAGGWFTGDPASTQKDQMFKYCQDQKDWP